MYSNELDYDPSINTSYSSNILSAYQYTQSSTSPDLILLNINVNCLENSFDLIERFYRLGLHIPIIVLSSIDSIEVVTLAIENKVSGFISQKHCREEIMDSLIYVLEENMFSHMPLRIAAK